MAYTYSAGTTTPTYAGLVEFGGIRINDGCFKSEHLGGLVDGAPVRQAVAPLPNDSGGFAGSAFLNPREIELSGWLLQSSPDDVFGAMDALRLAFALGTGSLSTLVCNQRGWATRRQVLARPSGPVVFSEPDVTRKKMPVRDFTVPLVAPDPLLYDADNLRTLDIPMTGASTAVTNSGNAPTYMIARFVGPFSVATLTRESDGAVITYNGSLTAGHYIDIQTNPTVGLTAVSDLSVNTYPTISAWTLFTIPAGTTNFHAAATSGTTGASKVTLTWRDAWY